VCRMDNMQIERKTRKTTTKKQGGGTLLTNRMSRKPKSTPKWKDNADQSIPWGGLERTPKLEDLF